MKKNGEELYDSIATISIEEFIDILTFDECVDEIRTMNQNYYNSDEMLTETELKILIDYIQSKIVERDERYCSRVNEYI